MELKKLYMVIAHYKQTNIAKAPEAICDIINKYTDHTSYVFGFERGNILTRKTDVLHNHNLDVIPFKGKKLIQYHSEPFRVDLNTSIHKCVIAQYHATLPEYQNMTIVRNPIDIYDEIFIPKYINNKVRIGYSPSTVNPASKWADKGYHETVSVLNKLKDKYGDKIDIDVITNVPLRECLDRKSRCNIFIDEVKTKSYHRSSLESLAMGIPTICSIGNDVQEILKHHYNIQLPIINTYINGLELALINLIEIGPESLNRIGHSNRIWMENNWNPETIANEYINIYKSL